MPQKHFYEQRNHARSYLIPYFRKHLPDFENLGILEIGCAEAGFLDALDELGIKGVGLELEPRRIQIAYQQNPKLKIYRGDITNNGIAERIGDTFDLIVMRDVIEHISDRVSTFANLRKLMSRNGFLYVAFPPRFSPFAGHQQNGDTILRFVPYLHLFPNRLIRLLGSTLDERPQLIEHIISNARIGLSVGAFEKYCSQFSFSPIVKELFLVRPIHKTRFGITPRRTPNVPFLREFITLGYECLLQKKS